MSLMNPTPAESREMGLMHKIASLQDEIRDLRDLIQCTECSEELHGNMYYGWLPGLCPGCQGEMIEGTPI